MSTDLATIRNGEIIDAEIVQPATMATAPSVLAPIIRAELDSAILMAKQYPREITKFLDKATSYATLSYVTAKQCCYSKPRAGGKPDEGPSVRLAEIVAATYGNIRVDAYIIEERERYVVAQAVAQDLEANNTWRSQVRRGVWGKSGRFSEDLINTTCNAAISIASRNVVFRVVPRAIYWPVYLECYRIVQEGTKAKTLTDQRADWLAFARENGFREAEVFTALGVKGADDIGVEQLRHLAGFQTLVDTHESTWEDIFRPRQPEVVAPAAPQPGKADQIAGRFKDKAKAGKPDDADMFPAGKE